MMTHQAASATILKNVLLIFSSVFLVFALLDTSLSYIFQSLFGVLISVPTYTMLALFALVITLALRQNCVEEIPSNTVGLVCSSNGDLKTLAPAGPVWVWLGRERLCGLLALEPVSAHLPLLGLKSRDGVKLPPLVTIITWRIDAKITTLFASQYGRQVAEVAQESQWKRERRVRDQVAEVIARWAAQEPIEVLKDHLAHIHANSFGQAVIEEINQYLAPIGLSVERLECIGGITLPVKASAAEKTPGAAREKSKRLVLPITDDAPVQEIEVEELHEQARQAVQKMREVSRAADDYVQAVIQVLEPARQQLKNQEALKAAGMAQKALGQRLTELAAAINALLMAANELKRASEQSRGDAPSWH
jgi:hypothetical protein